MSSAEFYVDANSFAATELREHPDDPAVAFIAAQPFVQWLFPEQGDSAAVVTRVLAAAAGAGRTPAFCVYGMPNRDCGGWSAGGCRDVAAYRAWIAGIADRLDPAAPSWLVLEPDALMVTWCLSRTELADRLAALREAVAVFEGRNARVYLDGGDGWWMPATADPEAETHLGEMAGRLALAGVGDAHGFALNVANFTDTARLADYAQEMSALLGGKHFVLDTSRNGNGRDYTTGNINPPGRALGAAPTADTGIAHCDAFLWVKYPGSSDGRENGGPPAGQWWPDYARSLYANMDRSWAPRGSNPQPTD